MHRLQSIESAPFPPSFSKTAYPLLCTAQSPMSCWGAAGAITCTGFIHNILRRHPACQVLLHRPLAQGAAHLSVTSNGETPSTAAPAIQSAAAAQPLANGHSVPASAQPDAPQPGRDPYDENEPDPAKSQALASSLWEVESLREHYCPQVGLAGC